MTEGVDEIPLPTGEAAAGYRETEIGDIPAGWKVEKLKSAVDITRKPRGLRIAGFGFLPSIPMEFVPDNGTYETRFILKDSAMVVA